MDIYGGIVLFFALIVASVLQTAFIFGAMFVLHKLAADKLPESTYGKFDFDHITKPAVSELLVRLAAIFFPVTIVLHMLEFFLFGTFGTRAHPLSISVVLFLLESIGIVLGLVYILKTDRPRTVPLAIVSALFYLLLYAMFIYRGYLIA